MLKSIQSLRGIFTFFIYLHHLNIFQAGGDSGVCFFIVLSGFVLCSGYQKSFERNEISYGVFMERRVAKIYPLHVLCWIAAFILTFSMNHNPITWLINLLLLQSWSPNPDIHFSANSVSWFLSVMIFYYFLFPFIIRFINKSYKFFIIWSVILFIIYFVIIQFIPLGMLNSIIYINPLLRLPDFILGIIIWQIIGDRIKNRSLKIDKIGIIGKSTIELSVVLLFILTLMIYNAAVSPRYGLVSLWWPASIALISVFSLFNVNGGVVTRLLQVRPLVFFGNISFSFYMVHVLVIWTAYRLLAHFDLEMPLYLFTFLVFVLTVALAYIVWRFFEKPITNRLRR